LALPPSTVFMYVRQIGAATSAACAVIGVLSLLPTHTPATMSCVKPSVQASRKFSVVPVFTPTCTHPVAWLLPQLFFKVRSLPNSYCLALLSDSMSDIIEATCGSSACLPLGDLVLSSIVLPFWSYSFKIGVWS